ncbi:GNAT family N-acetyltransferase [Crossiella sp. CA-258035]|uniref:GNAT family N-acetyltransferase n=1 Tax=Crossiella sp. CA-258035 TaxID=2981138 RepID=UPI0024BC8B46|nr:GNAT family N-acetyltransferase [Crossiella sp. CA-258035]WHT20335.1 GNAT family N-acetyltransferase [Crossiella sp. CA-258035]
MTGRRRFQPLEERSFPLLEKLFGPNGAQSGCWCMWFRRTNAEISANGSAGNRAALAQLSRTGQPIGLLAVQGETPVGWVAVAPREQHSRLARSKVAAPASKDEDTAGVWSVTCFFVHRTARGQGLTGALLAAAVDYAREHGAERVEGFPVDTLGAKKNSGELYHGTLNLFLDAGFRLVERRGTHRALVRREL